MENLLSNLGREPISGPGGLNIEEDWDWDWDRMSF